MEKFPLHRSLTSWFLKNLEFSNLSLMSMSLFNNDLNGDIWYLKKINITSATCTYKQEGMLLFITPPPPLSSLNYTVKFFEFCVWSVPGYEVEVVNASRVHKIPESSTLFGGLNLPATMTLKHLTKSPTICIIVNLYCTTDIKSEYNSVMHKYCSQFQPSLWPWSSDSNPHYWNVTSEIAPWTSMVLLNAAVNVNVTLKLANNHWK